MRVSVSVTIIILLVGNGLFSQDCPEKIAEYDGGPVPYSYYGLISVEGDYLYVSNMPENGMISIFDISSPENPVLRSEFFPEACDAHRLIVQNNTLYYKEFCPCPAVPGFYCDGIIAWDVSDPDSPQKLFHYMTSGNIDHAAVKGNLAFLALWDSSLEILEMNHPDLPRILSTIVFPCWIQFIDHIVFSDDSVAYISCSGYKVIVLDFHDPENPVIVSELFPMEGMYLTDMEARDNLLYISGPDFGLAIFEIQEDYSLTELGRWNNYMGLKEIELAGELLVSRYYDSCLDEQVLIVLNVSNPAAIEEVGNWSQSHDWGFFQDAFAATPTTVIMGDEPDGGDSFMFHVFDITGCHSRSHTAPVTPVLIP